jgi:SAM-dependent methyltransferase
MLLDLGCGFAQDIRKLAFDETPAENLYGVDLHNKPIDLGYNMLRDKESLKSRFVIADIFGPNSDLKLVNGSIDIIHAWAFFHLFDLEG